MEQLNAGLMVVYFTGGLISLALVAVLLRPLWMPLWRIFRRTEQFLEDWFGEPARPGEGVAGRPGAMARLAQLESNGGSSLKDAVERIEAEIGEVRVAAEAAVTAAGQAVSEAKVGRAITAEAADKNRRNVSELRSAVSGLAAAIEEDEHERRQKERAYVAALNKLGVPLAPITDALDNPDGPAA